MRNNQLKCLEHTQQASVAAYHLPLCTCKKRGLVQLNSTSRVSFTARMIGSTFLDHSFVRSSNCVKNMPRCADGALPCTTSHLHRAAAGEGGYPASSGCVSKRSLCTSGGHKAATCAGSGSSISLLQSGCCIRAIASLVVSCNPSSCSCICSSSCLQQSAASSCQQ